MTEAPLSRVNTAAPHSARVWNYWLGGKDNYAPDREAGDKVAQLIPDIRDAARADRAFLGRAVRYLASEVGIRQFLDIGTGLPTHNNTHEVAQSVAPDCRIVYVDNDPMILAHARALLTSHPQGSCAYIDADLREPATILDAAATTLNFDRPVALMLLGIVHHIIDDEQAYQVGRHLIGALAPGSHVAIAWATAEVHGQDMHEAMRIWMDAGGTPIKARPPATIREFLEGLDVLEPGVVSCSLWRPDPSQLGTARPVSQFCAVARKNRTRQTAIQAAR